MRRDNCKICGIGILWLAGGFAWIHEIPGDGSHRPEPTRRTDLKPYLGCTLHQDELRPDKCNKCARLVQEMPIWDEWGNPTNDAARNRVSER